MATFTSWHPSSLASTYTATFMGSFTLQSSEKCLHTVLSGADSADDWRPDPSGACHAERVHQAVSYRAAVGFLGIIRHRRLDRRGQS